MENISSISNLEAEVLLIIWDKGKVTTREVDEAFIRKEITEKQSGFIPYTTIMSTMKSLARKRILEVNKSRKTYIYSAVVTREELARSIVKSVEEKFL